MNNRNTLNDQRSRDRIVSELDRNLLVEAGAGSGKTHMMAARMAAGVASGAYAIERMAAVTFTRKAARNLRRLEWLDICLLETAHAAADAGARSYHSRNTGKGPGGWPKRGLTRWRSRARLPRARCRGGAR